MAGVIADCDYVYNGTQKILTEYQECLKRIEDFVGNTPLVKLKRFRAIPAIAAG